MKLVNVEDLKVLVAVESEGSIRYGKLVTDLFDDIPIVEAIPIEWIRSQKVDYQNNYLPFDYCRGMQDGYNCCIDYLIDKWEEENEENI